MGTRPNERSKPGSVKPGDVFAQLTVIEPRTIVKPSNGYRTRCWLCRCDCGNETVVIDGNLRFGNTRSCGCTKPSRIAEGKWKHGEGKRTATTREYHSWCRMNSRCANRNDPKFPRYGGRGITVCEAWRRDYAAFLRDMGRSPSGTTLHRIENDGNYELANCKWAGPKEQASNTSRIRLSDDDVRAIRASPDPRPTLAARYGVTEGYVKDIQKKRARGNVP